MDAPFLTVAVWPGPGDDRTAETIGDVLLERGARPDGDGFFIGRHGRMRVQPDPRWDAGDTRPVEILMSAGPLGDPGHTRRQMTTFARHLTGLLVAVADRTRPLYAGIGVEDVFPTPDQLRDGVTAQGFVTDPFFVRRDLLAHAELGAVLAGEFRRTVETGAGTVFASWWPFVDGHPGTPGGLPARGMWAGGRILGRVAARHIAGHGGRW
ncbi:hypothetical protein AB0G04_11940 [Actinoplanes sp. NPDC023801]|uniref:hypothetical protein n=1 Tax=Actinoplanes sp. NPDC023801 TaxID=3154595 RepID=UPI0033C306BC